MAAVPDWPLATNRTTATPLSVRASVGESAAEICRERDGRAVLNGRAARLEHRRANFGRPVRLDDRACRRQRDRRCLRRKQRHLVARHGQIPRRRRANAHRRRFPDRPSPVMMESIRIEMSNYNSPMNLAAKASAGLPRRSARGGGYAMAALLVGLAVMAVMLSVAMPTWSHMIRREKEEELIFRGTQYARAINQYQRKFANASPAEPRRADRAAFACERNSGTRCRRTKRANFRCCT